MSFSGKVIEPGRKYLLICAQNTLANNIEQSNEIA